MVERINGESQILEYAISARLNRRISWERDLFTRPLSFYLTRIHKFSVKVTSTMKVSTKDFFVVASCRVPTSLHYIPFALINKGKLSKVLCFTEYSCE